ncbi:MAG: hypothetical protein AAF563_02370 [Pseudomonadota bacterium]
MTNILFRFVIFGLVAAFPWATASADEVTVSGSATYIQRWGETITLENGGRLERLHLQAIIHDDNNSPIDMNAQDCTGTAVYDADGAFVMNTGHCHATDLDGDTWSMWYHHTPDGNTWGIMGGTGKFAGLSGGGTTFVETIHADGRLFLTYEGTIATP